MLPWIRLVMMVPIPHNLPKGRETKKKGNQLPFVAILLTFFLGMANIFKIFSVNDSVDVSEVICCPATSIGTNPPATMPPVRGMTLNAWSAEAYNSSDFDQSIANLANVKAN